jgi:hypothetical protein
MLYSKKVNLKAGFDGTPTLEEYKKYSNDIQYKYDEDVYLKELSAYVNATYGEHYSKNKFQATEFIIDGGHGDGFCIGNIMKYAQRYGNKDGHNRKDLLKVLHYALIQLHVHDKEGRN